MESDGEYEEEETLVVAELHGVIDSEIFARDSLEKFKILAVDSERPVMQVENFVFSGEYDHAMGTAIFFEEEDKRVKKCDPVFCKKPPRMLKYVCRTNKKLTMKRVFVSERLDEDGADAKSEHPEDCSPSASERGVNPSDPPTTDAAVSGSADKETSTSDPLSLEDTDGVKGGAPSRDPSSAND